MLVHWFIWTQNHGEIRPPTIRLLAPEHWNPTGVLACLTSGFKLFLEGGGGSDIHSQSGSFLLRLQAHLLLFFLFVFFLFFCTGSDTPQRRPDIRMDCVYIFGDGPLRPYWPHCQISVFCDLAAFLINVYLSAWMKLLLHRSLECPTCRHENRFDFLSARRALILGGLKGN